MSPLVLSQKGPVLLVNCNDKTPIKPQNIGLNRSIGGPAWTRTRNQQIMSLML